MINENNLNYIFKKTEEKQIYIIYNQSVYVIPDIQKKRSLGRVV